MDLILDRFENDPFLILFLALLGTVFLLRAVPPERRSVMAPFKLFLIAFCGHLISRFCNARFPDPVWRLALGLAVFTEGLALTTQAGILLFRFILPTVGITSPRILQDVLVAGAQIIWGLLTLDHAGVNLTGLIATSAVLTGVIGFSMQDTLGNILAGLAIQIDDSLHVGDWIKLNDLVGRVVETSWRYTAVETRNWETILIPNGVLMKNQFLVLGRRQGKPLQWRRWIFFNVDFRYSPSRVLTAVESAIRGAQIPNVAADPPASCVLLDFAESYGRYALRYWLTDLACDDGTDSQVRLHVFSALQRAGLSLALPAHAVFMTEETAERQAQKLAVELERRREALASVDLFRHLTPEEHARLAERLLPSPFVAGDVMTRQGAEAHWLYIISDGQAEVLGHRDGQEDQRIAQLGPGNFFGEWSLLTGEPRHATVIANTDLRAWRLDRDSFKDILLARPEIAEEISAILAIRKLQLEATLQQGNSGDSQRRLTSLRHSILDQIRGFFGLDGKS